MKSFKIFRPYWMVDSHLFTSCSGSDSMNSGKYSGNLEMASFEISLCNEIHIFTHLGLFAKIFRETCSISWLGKANARTNVSHEVISMEYRVHLAVNWIHCLMLWVQLRFLAFFFGFDRFVAVWNFKNYEIFLNTWKNERFIKKLPLFLTGSLVVTRVTGPGTRSVSFDSLLLSPAQFSTSKSCTSANFRVFFGRTMLLSLLHFGAV